MKNFLCFFVLIIITHSCWDYKIQSPNKNVESKVFINSNNRLSYNVSFKGEQILDESILGIVVDGDTLGNESQIKLIGKESIKENYITRGVHTEAVNWYNQYTYEILSKEGKIYLHVRAYNDGIAFRYIVPGNGERKVCGELTSFGCPHNIPVWFFARNNDWKLKTYAGEWKKTMSDSLSKISPNGPVQAPILLYELKSGGYMGITEAALYNYSGLRLRAKDDASLHVNFTEDQGFCVGGEIITPWRVILLVDNLNELVNTDIITNLNPVPDKNLFSETDYINPGRSVWSWWSASEDFMTVDFEKHLIDRAKELNFEYTTLDEGWEKWNDKWNVLRDICAYAAEKNVGVFVWKHSREINFPDNDYQTMRLFLDSLTIAGVKGVKIDFMNGEDKSIIDFDTKALQFAAERKLLVNFHGCQKPSGEFRRYPNEITREGIRGLELNKMNEPISGNHNVALVFTRCILNNSDYTPIGFSNPGTTSWAHQLATAYAFTSPLITLAEHPDTLYLNPRIKPVLSFIKDIPAIWDETIVLDGSSIDETAILARRKEDIWYLIILNGFNEKKLKVKLDFLEKGLWKMSDVRDEKGIQKSMSINQTEKLANQIIEIDLNREGGYVAKFEKIN